VYFAQVERVSHPEDRPTGHDHESRRNPENENNRVRRIGSYAFSYDGENRLESITDGDGLETTVERDTEGRVGFGGGATNAPPRPWLDRACPAQEPIAPAG
jgi:YD repeat-containing protein